MSDNSTQIIIFAVLLITVIYLIFNFPQNNKKYDRSGCYKSHGAYRGYGAYRDGLAPAYRPEGIVLRSGMAPAYRPEGIVLRSGYTDKPLNFGDLGSVGGMFELEHQGINKVESFDSADQSAKWSSDADVPIRQLELTKNDAILDRAMFGSEVSDLTLGFRPVDNLKPAAPTGAATLILTDYKPEYGPAKGNVTA